MKTNKVLDDTSSVNHGHYKGMVAVVMKSSEWTSIRDCAPIYRAKKLSVDPVG